MSRPSSVRAPWSARVAAGACLGLAAWCLYAFVRSATSILSGDDVSAAEALFSIVLLAPASLALVALLTWLAGQLWFQFSAATVRWVTGAAVVVAALMISSIVTDWLDPMGLSWIGSTILLVLVIAGAVAFRFVTHWLIARAGVDDPRDYVGQPAGHAARVKLFCVVLGWGVFVAGSDIVRGTGVIRSASTWVSLLGLAPILLGWLTYRIVLRWLTSPTRDALPPGGFEVISSPPPPRE